MTAAAIAVACGSSKTSASRTLSFVQVIPQFAMINIGQRVQMQAMAGYTDNSVEIVKTEVTWQTSDSSVVSILSNGRATSLQSGTATVRATYKGVTGSLQLYIGADYYNDCYNYGPETLQIIHPSNGFVVSDSFGSWIASLASQADAEDTLALAQRYRSICWIGRIANPRPNPQSYMVNYWGLPSGQATTISREDCVSYSPGSLQTVNLGAQGWAVMDGAVQIALLDDQPDATLTLNVARQYSAHCFIGRGNTQPNPDAFTYEYWK